MSNKKIPAQGKNFLLKFWGTLYGTLQCSQKSGGGVSIPKTVKK